MAKNNPFQRYIPRIADRNNSVRAFVLAVVGGMLIIFGVGFYVLFWDEKSEDIDPVSDPIEYKGGFPEVHRAVNLYDNGKYVDAIELVDSLLSETATDVNLPQLHRELANKRNSTRDYELTWVKINSLVAMGHEKESKEILDTYINIGGPYQEEATKLRSCIIDLN